MIIILELLTFKIIEIIENVNTTNKLLSFLDSKKLQFDITDQQFQEINENKIRKILVPKQNLNLQWQHYPVLPVHEANHD